MAVRGQDYRKWTLGKDGLWGPGPRAWSTGRKLYQHQVEIQNVSEAT